MHRRANGTVRPRTISRRTLAVTVRLERESEPVDDLPTRPRTRAECIRGVRPCPFVSCRHHTYLDVNPSSGSLRINFPDRDPWELEITCTLDAADDGGITLEAVGHALNLTRERVRQVERDAYEHYRERANLTEDDR